LRIAPAAAFSDARRLRRHGAFNINGARRGQAAPGLLGWGVSQASVAGVEAMVRVVSVLVAGALLALLAAPGEAAGKRRVWRGPPPIGAISRDVITPWYVGYFGSHYSYYPPDPMPAYPYCRRWSADARLVVC
jgi:hypothetical protein